MKVSLTFDVEKDLHSSTYNGLEFGIPALLQILNKHKIKATFFVPAQLLKKFPDYLLFLKNQGHEIALHGFAHERFDILSAWEKQIRIVKSVEIYKKIFNQYPKGFRAPQHSIDAETLDLLKDMGFLYDASYTPFNLLQLLFFPKRFQLWLKGFFKKREINKIGDNFYEIPTSSFILPFVSLPLRIFPWPILKVYLWVLKRTSSNLVFYAHSWDFIELPKSKTDKYFSYRRLISNLDKMIKYLSEKGDKFSTMHDLIG